MRLQTGLEQLRQRQTELNEQIGATQFQRAEADRKLKRVGEKFVATQARQR